MDENATHDDVRLPPGPRLPGLLQGVGMLVARRPLLRLLRRRYGPDFTMRFEPFDGGVVVLSDPEALKQLFTARPAIVGNPEPNLGRVLGAGSVFSLDGDEHRRRRKLLTPPFHGRRLRAYAGLMEEEARREMATWPEGEEFETLEPFMRITLNIILRTVFGAEGAEFEALRRILPEAVLVGSKTALMPPGVERVTGLGAKRERLRAEYEAVVFGMIDAARADPGLAERDDVLAMLVQSRYEDGEAMTRQEMADELMTLLAAGHETTATTLAWAVERLRRHPGLTRRLIAEADAGGSELRLATLLEVQRTRPVIIITARRVNARTRLGSWVVPEGYTVFAGIDLVQNDERVVAGASRFDPDRFVGAPPESWSWIPFGGGTRRCVGASFATLELDVVLRTLLTEFDLRPTRAPGERWRSRGVAHAPARGGRVVLGRRRAAVEVEAEVDKQIERRVSAG